MAKTELLFHEIPMPRRNKQANEQCQCTFLLINFQKGVRLFKNI